MNAKRRLLVVLMSGAMMLTGCIQIPNGDDSTPRFTVPNNADEHEVTRTPEPPPVSFDERISRADQLRDSGQVEEAVLEYIRALYLDYESPLPRQRIAFMQLGRDAARGETIFRKLIDKHPTMASARVGLGLAMYAAGRYDAARESLEFAAALDPKSDIAISTLGLIDDETGHHDRARRRFLRAKRLAPSNYEISNNLGMSYLMTQEFEKAAESFREAIFINPGDPAVFNNLGFALGRMKQYGPALETFRRFGSEGTALNNTGYTCFLNRDYGLAIRYYEKALVTQPTDRERVLVNLRNAENALLARSPQAEITSGGS